MASVYYTTAETTITWVPRELEWFFTQDTTTGTAGNWPDAWLTSTASTTTGIWPAQWLQQPKPRATARYHPVPASTPEQRAAAARAAQEAAEAAKLAHQRKLAAQKRAEELLFAHLTPEQIADYRKFNAFNVVSLDGHRYRIHKGRVGNVRRLEGDKAVEKFCIHTLDHQIPEADNLLAQKLLLECSPDEFLRIANRTRMAPQLVA